MAFDEAIRFGRYNVHPTQGLKRGQREIRLTPKSLRVLCALAERSGQVVSKDELFRTVWPDAVVTDATLISCVKELRQALNDDARVPRYIETVHRRGFRFLPRTSSDAHRPRDSGLVSPPRSGLTHIVGRNVAIEQMNDAFARAREGSRQFVFVSGEPGIGKTALADVIQAQLSQAGGCALARADCIQHYGAREAYQPLLEVVARLARLAILDDIREILRQLAPLWLAQLPALQALSDVDLLRRRTGGATPERMLRELTDALEAMSERTPLVLCIEDLHWGDGSTIDWLASFARRRERAHVLIICTYRSGESEDRYTLAASLADDLRVRGLCTHIELAPLDENAVMTYLTGRFPPAAGSESAMQTLAHAIHQRTEGNPLFFVSVLNELLAQSTLARTGERWVLQEQPNVAALRLPPDLRRAIERQLSRLGDQRRRLLDVASIVGKAFPAASVAAGACVSASEAEGVLADLSRRGAVVRETGITQWPDGTTSATFEFTHTLYAEVLAAQLSAGCRASMHRAVGLRLETAFGTQAPQIATELAMHFEFGRDFSRAIRFHEHAAQSNLRRNAHDIALQHFRRALSLLVHVAEPQERDETEINLQIGLGNVLMQTGGWAAPDVQAAYTRAHELCRRRDSTPRLFPALWNLWVFSAASGGLHEAHTLAVKLHELACDSADPESLLQAHHANWSTLYSIGDLRGSAAHASNGMALYQLDSSDAEALEYGSHDCGVCARMFRARALALFGQSSTAARLVDEALALAIRLEHPFTRAFALTHAAAVHLERGHLALSRDYGQAARSIAIEWRFSLLEGWASCYLGAALAESGAVADGLPLLREGIEKARATGSAMFQPHLLGLLAGAQLRNRSTDEAWRSVNAALEMSGRTGERFYAADLHRLKGELHLARSRDEDSYSLAEQEFRSALTIAQSQRASLPALRAAVPLSRLWATMGMIEKAAPLIADTYAQMTRGSDEADLAESRALLIALESQSDGMPEHHPSTGISPTRPREL